MSSTGSPLAGKQTWILGTGRRKESVARVFLRAGSGKFTVNGRTAEQYFPNFAWKHDAVEPLKFTNLADQVDVVITAKGGGVGGQAGAVRMGLARAISVFNPSCARAAQKWFSDSRFAHEGTQEVRAEGRSQAFPVHQALNRRVVIAFAGYLHSTNTRRRTPVVAHKRCHRDHGRLGAGKKAVLSRSVRRERKQQSLKEETWQ